MQNTVSIILSIRPKYVDAIINGSKSYEFRRTIFSNKRVSRVYIYSTAPVKRIVASFRIGEIVKDTPETLWRRFESASGLQMNEFFEYFEDCPAGYAIGVEDLERFDDPVDPNDLMPGFSPPQSFRYFEDRESGLSRLHDFGSS